MSTLNPLLSPQDLGHVVALSPHLDDAALGCGALLARCVRTTVVTVLAGVPRDAALRTDWDRDCGFADAAQAVSARRREDREALARLGCGSVHLPFLDGQYPGAESAERLAEGLAAALAPLCADTLLLPLGLFHSDHLRVRSAWLRAASRLEAARWIAYEDLPYRDMADSVQHALVDLHGLQWRASPARWLACQPHETSEAQASKLAALDCYRSQHRALTREWLNAALAAEAYWRLQPPQT